MSSSDELPARRRERRKNVLAGSPNLDEYIQLMKAGWSSTRLERYALLRYQESIAPQTFRRYKQRKNIKENTPDPVTQKLSELLADDMKDPVALRSELASWARQHVAIGLANEQHRDKLSPEVTRAMTAYNQILDALKEDQQDLGLMSKAGDRLEIQVDAGPQVQRMVTMEDLVGDDPYAQQLMSRHLFNKVKVIEGDTLPSEPAPEPLSGNATAESS